MRPTHSPTKFIQDLGVAYRASGRNRPVMDGLAIHPYGDNSSQPPSTGHPNSTTIGMGDYDKLVALLAQAFDGTAQPGSALPILYGEFGVESQIPDGKASLYTGNEPAVTRPVDESTQAAYYEQALALAFCQPTVEGMLIFLSRDERARAGWQSGVHYVDGTAKGSLSRVTEALDRTTGGSIVRCPGVQLIVRPTFLRFGTPFAARRGVFRLSLRCNLDCSYVARVERASTHSTKLERRGRLEVGELGTDRPRYAQARRGPVPLHAPSRAPGQPRAPDPLPEQALHPAARGEACLALNTGARAARCGRPRTRRRRARAPTRARRGQGSPGRWPARWRPRPG